MKKFLLTSFAIAAISLQAQTWTTQNTMYTNASTGISKFAIVDANTVWSFPYDGTGSTTTNYKQISTTTNGGTTWNYKAITFGLSTSHISDVCAVSGTQGWLACYGASGASGNGVYVTNDAGTTWTKQTTAPFSVSTSFPNVIHFWDANNGMVMGDPTSAGVFEIYTTTNGGTNWTAVPAANIPAAEAGEYGYVRMSNVVGNSIWFCTNFGRVYKSDDKGYNWTVFSTPIGDFGGASQSGSFTVKDSNNAWVLDSTGLVIYDTTDGGVNWNAVSTSGTILNSDLAYVPGTTKTLINTGTGGSQISYDGGVNWTVIDTTQKVQLGVLDGNSIWAGGFTTGSGASSTGGAFKLSPLLGTSEVSVKNAVNVAPNPTKGEITISSKNGVKSMQLLDLSGKIVKTFGNVKQLDLSSLKAGVYMLHVTTVDGKTTATKVVKQ